MNSNMTFLAKASVDLRQVNTTLNKIISQENDFLGQLTSFRELLHSAKILTNSTTKVKRGIVSTVQIERPNLNLGTLKIAKLSIMDIFTPYSVDSIGDTANINYKKMNKNFQIIHTTELKLAHQQRILANNYKSMQVTELAMARKEIFLELRSFKTQSLTNFLFDLHQILQNN